MCLVLISKLVSHFADKIPPPPPGTMEALQWQCRPSCHRWPEGLLGGCWGPYCLNQFLGTILPFPGQFLPIDPQKTSQKFVCLLIYQ